MEISRLRILFVHSGSDLYGASRSLLRLASRLVQDGAAVKVVLPNDGPLHAALEEKGVQVTVRSRLPVIERDRVTSLGGFIVLLMGAVLSMPSLLGLIADFKPHLIHSMTAVIFSPALAAKSSGIPHVWHVRESFGEFGRWWRYYQLFMYWFSTVIVCVSTPIARQFRRYPNERKIRVVHNGFPLDEFSRITPDRVQRFRAQYGRATGQLVGVVGRIKYRRKGQETFVRAASLLHEKFPEARFLCIGSPFPGNEMHLHRLLGLIRELGLSDYVLYTGDIEDIKAAIGALDILVLPSAQPEPFAGVVVEAMALSRPVVATCIGGSIEQVVDGVTGLLVEPGDPESMARAIQQLLESPDRRRILGDNGRARFLEKFEFEAFYRTILSLYDEAIEKA